MTLLIAGICVVAAGLLVFTVIPLVQPPDFWPGHDAATEMVEAETLRRHVEAAHTEALREDNRRDIAAARAEYEAQYGPADPFTYFQLHWTRIQRQAPSLMGQPAGAP